MKNNHNPIVDFIDGISNAVDKALVVAVDAQSPDVLLARLAEAHANVIKADVYLHVIDIPDDQPRIYADEPAAKPLPLRREAFEAAQRQQALPPLQKQPKTNTEGYIERPGIAKQLKRPRDFDCPTCHAEVGTMCFQMTSHGRNGVPTAERKSEAKQQYHAARYALSKNANQKIRAKYDREHFGDVYPAGGTR